jgi:hypothetical protein
LTAPSIESDAILVAGGVDRVVLVFAMVMM